MIPALVVWCAYTWTWGVIHSPDTATYLTAAESFREGTLQTGLHFRPYTGTEGSLFTGWPPLYPLVLAILMAVVSPDRAVAAVACGSWLGLCALTPGILRTLAGREEAGWLAGPLLATFPALFVCTRGWSEGPWLVLFAATTLALARWLETFERGGRVGLLLGLLVLTRYASLPLALVTPCCAALWTWGQRARLRGVVPMVLMEIVVAGPWLMYSIWRAGRLGYLQPPSNTPLSTTLSHYAEAVLTSLVVPPLGLGTLVLALLLAAVVTQKGRVNRPLVAWLVASGLLGALVYLAVRWGHHVDEPDVRVTLPLTLPLLWCFLGWVGSRLVEPTVRWIGAAGLVLALVGAGLADVHDPKRRPMPFMQSGRYHAIGHFLAERASTDDLVFVDLGMVVRRVTHVAVATPLSPPYGHRVTLDELEHAVDTWPGQVWFVGPNRLESLDAYGALKDVVTGDVSIRATEVEVTPKFRAYKLTRSRTEL